MTFRYVINVIMGAPNQALNALILAERIKCGKAGI
jgi:hypothetical protein